MKFLRPINWYPQVVDAPIDATTGTAGDGYFYWNLEQFIKFTDWRLLAADVPDASKKGYNYPGDTKNYAVVRGYTVKVNADNTLTETTTKTIKNPEIEYWKYYGITFDSRASERYLRRRLSYWNVSPMWLPTTSCSPPWRMCLLSDRTI